MLERMMTASRGVWSLPKEIILSMPRGPPSSGLSCGSSWEDEVGLIARDGDEDGNGDDRREGDEDGNINGVRKEDKKK